MPFTEKVTLKNLPPYLTQVHNNISTQGASLAQEPYKPFLGESSAPVHPFLRDSNKNLNNKEIRNSVENYFQQSRRNPFLNSMAQLHNIKNNMLGSELYSKGGNNTLIDNAKNKFNKMFGIRGHDPVGEDYDRSSLMESRHFNYKKHQLAQEIFEDYLKRNLDVNKLAAMQGASLSGNYGASVSAQKAIADYMQAQSQLQHDVGRQEQERQQEHPWLQLMRASNILRHAPQQKASESFTKAAEPMQVNKWGQVGAAAGNLLGLSQVLGANQSQQNIPERRLTPAEIFQQYGW